MKVEQGVMVEMLSEPVKGLEQTPPGGLQIKGTYTYTYLIPLTYISKHESTVWT